MRWWCVLLGLAVACGRPTPIELPTQADDRAALLDLGDTVIALELDDGQLVGDPVIVDIGDTPTARVHVYTRTLADLGLEPGPIEHRDDRSGRPFPTPTRTTSLEDEEWQTDVRFSGIIASSSLPWRSACRTFGKAYTKSFVAAPLGVVSVGHPDVWEEHFALVSLTRRTFFVADRDRADSIDPPVIDPSICSTCEVTAMFRGFSNEVLFTYDDALLNDVDGAVWQTTITNEPPTWADPKIVLTPTRDFEVRAIAGRPRQPVTAVFVLAYEFAGGGYEGLVDRLPIGAGPEAVFAMVSTTTMTVTRPQLAVDVSGTHPRTAALWPFDGTLYDSAHSLMTPTSARDVTAIVDIPSFGLVIGDRFGALFRMVDGVAKPLSAATGAAIDDIAAYEGGLVVADRAGRLRQFLVDGDGLTACSDAAALSSTRDLRIAVVGDDVVVLGATPTGATLDWWRTR